MHAISDFGTSVPAFLAKLWKLVEDPKTDDLICWSPSGRSFFIRNQAQFAKELLPHYYKHNNMASFVRQLNMYGFHKKVSVELGGLKCDKDEMEFAHQYFIKGVPELVERIKRKMTSSKLQDSGLPALKPEVMSKMVNEIKNMKGRQEHFESKMIAMKRENEVLWRELAVMRQKHIKQQQIVNKLIHFLVTLVQPPRGSGISVKRRYPLMIDGLNRQHKQPKLATKSQASPTGPVIHELDSSEPDLESEEYIVAEMLDENPTVESPQEHIEVSLDDDNIEPAHLIEDLSPLETNTQMDNSQNETDAKKKRSCKGKRKEIDHHFETMQAGLDNVRELFRGEFLRNENYSIDANALLGLFDKDDQMTLDFSASPELNPNGEKEIDDSSIIPDVNGSVGGELMAYNPSSNMMDFDDLLENCASSSHVSSDLPANNPYTAYYPDPLNLGDAEDSIFDSIVPNDANTKM